MISNCALRYIFCGSSQRNKPSTCHIPVKYQHSSLLNLTTLLTLPHSLLRRQQQLQLRISNLPHICGARMANITNSTALGHAHSVNIEFFTLRRVNATNITMAALSTNISSSALSPSLLQPPCLSHYAKLRTNTRSPHFYT